MNIKLKKGLLVVGLLIANAVAVYILAVATVTVVSPKEMVVASCKLGAPGCDPSKNFWLEPEQSFARSWCSNPRLCPFGKKIV